MEGCPQKWGKVTKASVDFAFLQHSQTPRDLEMKKVRRDGVQLVLVILIR